MGTRGVFPDNMDVVSIVNGNVCGRFRDVLTWKVLFLQVHNNASLVSK
jgi:hypothetical protein